MPVTQEPLKYLMETIAKRILELASLDYLPGGAFSTYAYRGTGQSRKFICDPKVSLQLHWSPEISAHLILRNLYMNIEYPEKMQIEVKIASSEPRNIS